MSRRLHRQHTEVVNYRYALKFARWASRRVPTADVVQAWTGYALEPMAAARRKGATTIAFRASAHIRTQVELLRDEFLSFGLQPPRGHDAIIDRECEEYESADFVNVISSFALRTFLERGFPRSRLILTPLAADVGEVAVEARRSVLAGPLRVLFLGNVSLQKGVHYLLEAAHSLGSTAITLSLVGGVSADGAVVLKRMARPGEWKGPVQRARLREVFREHDVLVLPSIQDGFGAVLCEAMAAGLPVIATANTGAPDVVRDGVDGLIVRARSSAALRDALELLVVNRERALEMGRSAAAAMAGRRTWDHFAADLIDQYGRARARPTGAT
jgi:glycosyltransferase involved in cell wall biosynthesis